ncbi:MAG: hypothetical protein ACLUI7_07020 [Coprococcus sp.]
MLEEVGLTARKDVPSQLSGEQQRVAIARWLRIRCYCVMSRGAWIIDRKADIESYFSKPWDKKMIVIVIT